MSRTKTATLNIILGAMTFGKPGAEQTRLHSLPACSAILDVFQRRGHREIDTARFYGEGSSEEYLGQLDWQKRGLIMDTKYYPTAGRTMSKSNEPAGGWKHTPEHLRQNLMDSLMALKTDNVDMWYLHGPDRTTDFEITLNAVNELHREGYFRRFGISNYMAWEVARICDICRGKGYIMPSVYQGLYNALHRSVEPELFECLRHYGVAFYNYNPLAGGYLTSRYKRDMKDEELESGSRFDPQKWQGKMYRARYWNNAYFDALDILRPVASKLGVTEVECALRWMTHHSKLKGEFGDGIIIGASSPEQLEQNLKALEDQRSLPTDIITALDAGWERVKAISGRYWH